MVEAKNLTRVFEGQFAVRAVDDVSMTVEKGEFVCLAGPSGSGKTTLLTLLGGLDVPTSGDVSIGGVQITCHGRRDLARFRLHHIGFVFQELNLLPVLTALENVEFGLMLQHVPARERKERALDVLRELGLGDLAGRKPAAMSGGQQQRVAVARAIVGRPELVLADEPTANLDSHSTQNLVELMLQLNRDKRITFVLATHDEQVLRQSRRVLYLRDGKIVKETA